MILTTLILASVRRTPRKKDGKKSAADISDPLGHHARRKNIIPLGRPLTLINACGAEQHTHLSLANTSFELASVTTFRAPRHEHRSEGVAERHIFSCACWVWARVAVPCFRRHRVQYASGNDSDYIVHYNKAMGSTTEGESESEPKTRISIGLDSDSPSVAIRMAFRIRLPGIATGIQTSESEPESRLESKLDLALVPIPFPLSFNAGANGNRNRDWF